MRLPRQRGYGRKKKEGTRVFGARLVPPAHTLFFFSVHLRDGVVYREKERKERKKKKRGEGRADQRCHLARLARPSLPPLGLDFPFFPFRLLQLFFFFLWGPCRFVRVYVRKTVFFSLFISIESKKSKEKKNGMSSGPKEWEEKKRNAKRVDVVPTHTRWRRWAMEKKR